MGHFLSVRRKKQSSQRTGQGSQSSIAIKADQEFLLDVTLVYKP
jgi:hypothetical protein